MRIESVGPHIEGAPLHVAFVVELFRIYTNFSITQAEISKKTTRILKVSYLIQKVRDAKVSKTVKSTDLLWYDELAFKSLKKSMQLGYQMKVA